jgi:hypothetical protein
MVLTALSDDAGAVLSLPQDGHLPATFPPNSATEGSRQAIDANSLSPQREFE